MPARDLAHQRQPESDPAVALTVPGGAIEGREDALPLVLRHEGAELRHDSIVGSTFIGTGALASVVGRCWNCCPPPKKDSNGSRLWRLAYRSAGKQKSLALGGYPAVSLLDARRLRDDAKRQLQSGSDPADTRRWISALVELSCARFGAPEACSSPSTFCASTLPSSTPHWSKLLMPQITPSTKVLCS